MFATIPQHPRAALQRGASILAASLLIASCGGSDLGSGERVVIGSAGGTFTLANGITLEVPEGAVTGNVRIAADLLTDVAAAGFTDLPDGIDSRSNNAIVLTPHGTVFSEPVRISFPTELVGSEVVLLRLDDENADIWQPDGAITIENGMVSFEVTHFSVYNPAVVAQGSCPCWSGADLASYKVAAAGESAVPSWRSWGGAFYDVKYVPFFIGNVVPAELRVSSSNSPSYSCERRTYRPTTYFTPVSIGLDVNQYRACLGLLYAAMASNTVTYQVAAYTTGLLATQTVGVTVTVTPPGGAPVTAPFTLDRNVDLQWVSGLFASGSTYSATITQQPSGSTCTIPTASGAIGTENVGIEVVCTTPTPTCFDVTAGSDTPTLAFEAASTIPLTDDFNGTALNPSLWGRGVSVPTDMSLAVSGGVMVLTKTGTTDNGPFCLTPDGGGAATTFTGNLDGTWTFALANPASDTPMAPFDFRFTDEVTRMFLFTVSVREDGAGTYTITLQPDGGVGDMSSLVALNTTTNSLNITYNPTTGAITATVMPGAAGAPIQLTATAATSTEWAMATCWQGVAASAGATVTALSLDSVVTNLTLPIPAGWVLSNTTMDLAGISYDVLGPDPVNAHWLNANDLVDVTEQRIDFDGQAPTIYARAVSVSSASLMARITVYSPLEDGPFATAMAASDGLTGATFTVDAKVVAYTRQGNGTYLAATVCP